MQGTKLYVYFVRMGGADMKLGHLAMLIIALGLALSCARPSPMSTSTLTRTPTPEPTPSPTPTPTLTPTPAPPPMPAGMLPLRDAHVHLPRELTLDHLIKLMDETGVWMATLMPVFFTGQ